MELAETECPWGPMAENERMMYLAGTIQAASTGYEEEGRKHAQSLANRIWRKLFGPQNQKS